MARRGVWQLQKLTVSYCEHSGSSSGARDFIAAHLPTFRAANPQLAVETLVKPGRHPTLDGSYLNGTYRSVPVRNTPAAGVAAAAAELRDAAGRKASVAVPGRRHVPAVRSKHVRGDAAGVQGGWVAGGGSVKGDRERESARG